MEWVLATLFIVAVVLLGVSFVMKRQTDQAEQRKVDTMYINVMEEINKLQTQMNKVELDGEITAQQVGVTLHEREMLRELLDLYKRGYSLQSMAEKTQMSVRDVEQLLAPFNSSIRERGKIAHGL
ncbi:hypothetical protein EJF36_02745 [Bacillus sp. HMF5848]|uniref:hypothetical protein n=1 Tax=Bacillus sp. HMF5848 TaxID=2495421 RepID=UPI000F7662BF|nr:hypothetical protein [Bacillus sp. HMF5848]RSK25895.1 hypothetical protein EJF36_02745 [Bacillus sp. HMF5848]